MQFYCIAMDLLYPLVCIKLRVYQFVSHNLKHLILLWSPISFSTTFAGHRGSWQRMLRNHQLICEKGVCRRCKAWCHGHWLNISNHHLFHIVPKEESQNSRNISIVAVFPIFHLFFVGSKWSFLAEIFPSSFRTIRFRGFWRPSPEGDAACLFKGSCIMVGKYWDHIWYLTILNLLSQTCTVCTVLI